MVSKTDVIVIGENLLGLYTGIKCLEKGYNVVIIEKYNKPSYINNIPIILSDNHKSFKKLLIKYNIEIVQTINNNDIIYSLITKAEKVPTVLQENMTFEQLCFNILNKQLIKILKNTFPYYDHIKNNNAIDGIIYLKHNYINRNHYILKDNSLYFLEKLRKSFYDLGGNIYYSTNVNNISFNNNILSCNYSNNYIINANIVISTLNKKNLLDIYDWNKESLYILNSIKSYNEEYINTNILNNIRIHLINDFNIAIPKYKDNSFLLNFNNEQIYDINKKFFICNDIFSKNKGWIDGSIRMINDIIHTF